MDRKGFQALVAGLGDLTPSQRAGLITALERKLPLNEAVKLIEGQFHARPACGHCGSQHVAPWGSASAMKRYRCKDCRRTFSALTGTPLAQLHRRDAWLAYGQALADGVSLRKAAQRCRIALDTSFRWRHRFLKTAKDVKAKAVRGIIEADETFVRKSAKGSKALVGRRPRKRGEKANPGLSRDDYAPVLIVRDRHGSTADHILPDLAGATIDACLAPLVERGGVLVSDGRDAYAAFAEKHGVLHIRLNASQGERLYEGFHIQNVNAYMSRLKDWLRRFKGVATRHLASYLGWWRLLDREREKLTAARCIIAALPHAST
jgi:Transposase and inactivated derivatives